MTFQPKLTPFKTLVFNIGIDSFQDPCSDYYSKTSEIDSFQDPYVLHRNWLISRPLRSTPNWTCYRIPGSELYWTQHNWLISRPSNWIYTVFQSPWETTCKNLHGRLPSGTFIKPSTRWILDFLGKIKRKTHRMQLVNSSQAASLARPAFGAAAFAKMHSFQDPKNFTHIIDSNNRVQTLSHRLRHRTRTP